jgi:hypothetical protein
MGVPIWSPPARGEMPERQRGTEYQTRKLKWNRLTILKLKGKLLPP